MHEEQRSRRRVRSLLALLAVGVLGLAASPAALAKDRGGPGQPGAQVSAYGRSQMLPLDLLSIQFVSWSD